MKSATSLTHTHTSNRLKRCSIFNNKRIGVIDPEVDHMSNIELTIYIFRLGSQSFKGFKQTGINVYMK